MLKYCDLTATVLLNWFPELEEKIKKEIVLSKGMPSCLYADVINPVLTSYFGCRDSVNKNLVDKIFDFFEYLASCGDDDVKNMLQVSLLESLWNTKESYEYSLLLMKPKTKTINNNISSYLSEP